LSGKGSWFLSTRRTATNPNASQGLGIQEVVSFLRRGALLALLAAIVAAGAAYRVTSRNAPVYEASVALLASQPGYGGSGLITPSPVDPGVYQTALMESTIAPTTLARLLGGTPSQKQVEAFTKNIHVSLQKLDISSVIRIAVDSSDPSFATNAANALADGLVSWDRERALQAVSGTIAALQQSLQEIDAELNATGSQAPSAGQKTTLQALRQERERQLASARATSESSVVVGLLSPLSRATLPDRPIGPKVAFKTVVAGIVGLILAYGLTFLRWMFDPRIRDREELAMLTGIPVLAEFPASGQRGRAGAAEAATFLRSNIMLVIRSGPPIVVAISSPQRLREKSGVAVGLAESLARAGHRTLLVDADLRHPSMTFGLDASKAKAPSLEVYLEAPDDAFEPVPISVGRKLSFDFVPSFTASTYPVELLNRGFGRLVARWRDAYDVILVDCPPVLPFADTLAIAPLCTGLVLCVSQKDSTRRDIAESMERLTQVGVNVLGSVLGNARARRHAGYQERRLVPREDGAGIDPYRTLAREPGMENVRVRER